MQALAPARGDLAVAATGRHTVVTVTGDLDDSTASSLRDQLLGLLNRGVASLVVDLRGVASIDTAGVGTLLRIHHRQALLGGSVHVVADQPGVLRVLDTMRLRRRLHVTGRVADVDRCCAGAPAEAITLPVQPPSSVATGSRRIPSS